jgi:hypothetical protein
MAKSIGRQRTEFELLRDLNQSRQICHYAASEINVCPANWRLDANNKQKEIWPVESGPNRMIEHSPLSAALAAICSHARRRIPEMAAERPVEMGKVGETYFKGDVGDLSILSFVANQECRCLFEALPHNMLRERLTGLLE